MLLNPHGGQRDDKKGSWIVFFSPRPIPLSARANQVRINPVSNYEEKKKYRLKTFSVKFVTFNFNRSTIKKRKEKKKKTALYRCIDKKSRGRKGSNLVVDASSNARKFPIFNYEFRAIRHSLLTSKHRLRIYWTQIKRGGNRVKL